MLDEILCRPIVDILWVDSFGMGVWCSVDALGDITLECRTVGFLVAEDEISITVAPSLNCTGDCDSPIRIPKVAIKSREEITFV